MYVEQLPTEQCQYLFIHDLRVQEEKKNEETN